MLKQLLKLNRDYKDAKKTAAEHSLNVFESKTNPLYFIIFLASAILMWLITIFLPEVFQRLYNAFGVYLLVAFFIISYFSIFLGSKSIFKPTAEELSDDTSTFALFSACKRKETRSFYSIGLALLHIVIFVIYLLNQEL